MKNYRLKMDLPLLLCGNLGIVEYQNWYTRLLNPGRDRFRGVWRRHQNRENAHLSGWRSENDSRRKLISLEDKFSVDQAGNSFSFNLQSPFLWLHLTFPDDEIGGYLEQIAEGTKLGDWHVINQTAVRGNLRLEYKVYDSHPRDHAQSRTFPLNYSMLEVRLFKSDSQPNPSLISEAWDVFDAGQRPADIRQEPKILKEILELERFFPLFVELGSGPSYEAGVLPPHFYHTLYHLSKVPDKQIILGPGDDLLLKQIIQNPEGFFRNASEMYKSIIYAKTTDFYHLLRKMRDNKTLTGKVFTHNFDGLPLSVGLEEQFIRTFDDNNIYMEHCLPADAKGLLSVGIHADRRFLQRTARKRNLPIIFVDPEGFMHDGAWYQYRIEAPKSTDFLIQMNAKRFTDLYTSTFSTRVSTQNQYRVG